MPADAMRPPVPQQFSGRAARLVGRLGPDEPSRIILRSLVRGPLRTALTVSGLAAALALYVASASSTDNVDRMIAIAFERADRSDLVVTFTEPRDARALHALRRLPGVIRVEPFRATAARLTHGTRTETEGLTGGDAGGDLSRTVDMDGRIIPPAPRGAVLSSRLATLLGVGPGGDLEVSLTEGDRRSFRIPVAGVIETPLGSSAQVDRLYLNRLLREGESLSGAYLAVDASRLGQLYAGLKRMPQVAGVGRREAILQGIRATVAENMGIVTLFNTGFAALIVLGVVYNSARIALSERARDLASLRVLGFRRREVGFVLLGEQALLVLLSLPLGIAAGIALSRYITGRFSADMYTIPFGMSAATLAEGALVVCAAAALTAVLIRNRVDRLDLVRALKTRE
jgi:putative ABC transport system permease protein